MAHNDEMTSDTDAETPNNASNADTVSTETITNGDTADNDSTVSNDADSEAAPSESNPETSEDNGESERSQWPLEERETSSTAPYATDHDVEQQADLDDDEADGEEPD
jgi:hypothetical protein